ncbi:light-sensor Protein kinase-like [Selaginella moellendorffii]|uniref:light-sensor Protein kinase-like n=1 Tax=Selaginella moellendorffii TaxID=88036 RepID=UPI000D1CF0B9|nr:light-sensor Protein kinase-like [Selaginella moellendorffii]|eukprot:XP_024542112.1 light-sensor Protein kinase-like [Selaginella moellendorffii]
MGSEVVVVASLPPVLNKAKRICDSKSEVRKLAPKQCAYLIERVERLHKYLLDMIDFEPGLLEDCKPTIAQIDRVMDRAQFLLHRCSSPDWLWHAVLKKEHKLKFQIILQELSQCVYFLKLKVSVSKGTLRPAPHAWEWPESERQELKAAANMDREDLKRVAAKLEDKETDVNKIELGRYLLAEVENKRSQELPLPKYLFRNPEKVIQGKLIGEGSYAYVYEATWLGRTVATKAYAVQDPSSERELRALFYLRHPNIVKMVGYTQRSKEGPYVLLMERMKRDLHNLIKDIVQSKPGPPFEMDVAVDIVLQIARGMEFLHANDVSHLDLKTANILINLPSNECSFYTAKLSDFGLSETKLKSAQSKVPVRRGGTVNFMAPEIWNEEKNASRKKADVYSFGMTCYEIFTGKVPFEGCSYPAAGFFLRVKDNNLRPILPPGFPRCLSLFLQCCWHGRPEIRPTFKKICNYLIALKNVLTIGDPPDAVPDGYYLNSPIGDILDEDKQLNAMGTRDHHEAILAALESLQKESQDKLQRNASGAKYKSRLKSYIRDSEHLVHEVRSHKNKYIELQCRAVTTDEEEESSNSNECWPIRRLKVERKQR